ncbi:MAG: hypothetical protein GC152_03590 [Alphaproteobacteria bacterium]|nr:hypothetical protein [Alphaproteobacteria bacterium]
MREILVAGAASILFANGALAQTGNEDFTPPCEGTPSWVDTDAKFSDWDFWIGEWQVFAADSGELRGFDDIKKDFGGCVIRQHWRQMDDLFSLPGSPWRLQGSSVTGITAEGVWRQTIPVRTCCSPAAIAKRAS